MKVCTGTSIHVSKIENGGGVSRRDAGKLTRACAQSKDGMKGRSRTSCEALPNPCVQQLTLINHAIHQNLGKHKEQAVEG